MIRISDLSVKSIKKRVNGEPNSTAPMPTASTTARGTDDVSRGAMLDTLKLILAGAPLADVLGTVARLIEAQGNGMLCSIMLLDDDGSHLRYVAKPDLPQAYLRLTDGMQQDQVRVHAAPLPFFVSRYLRPTFFPMKNGRNIGRLRRMPEFARLGRIRSSPETAGF